MHISLHLSTTDYMQAIQRKKPIVRLPGRASSAFIPTPHEPVIRPWNQASERVSLPPILHDAQKSRSCAMQAYGYMQLTG